MEKKFKGKNIIITGGASGIGANLVMQLRALGASVIVIDRSPTNSMDFSIQADLSDIDQAREAFGRAFSKMTTVDYVINSAGIFMGGEIYDTPIENWHIVLDNNIYAVVHSAHIAYQKMVKQGQGHIVNIASTAGLIPVPAMGIYGASKYTIVGLSHAMRNEGSALGVKVSAACPTIVDTPLYETAIYNRIDKQRILRSRKKLQPAEVAARRILNGIVRNKATIHTTLITNLLWRAYVLFPNLYNRIARNVMATYRSELRQKD